MDVRVDASGLPALEHAADFTALRLTGTAPASLEARATLAAAGIELSDDLTHGHIEPAAFPRLAGSLAHGAEWQQGLEAMLAYATRKGWTDETGRVRAHAEWGT